MDERLLHPSTSSRRRNARSRPRPRPADASRRPHAGRSGRFLLLVGLIALLLAACSRISAPEPTFVTLTIEVPEGAASLDAVVRYDPGALEYAGVGSPRREVLVTAQPNGDVVNLAAITLEPHGGAMAYAVFRSTTAGDVAEPHLVSATARGLDGRSLEGARPRLTQGAVNAALSYDAEGARDLLAAHMDESDLQASFADFPLGDLDAGGSVTSGDALQILTYAVDSTVAPTAYEAYAANLDGSFDASGEPTISSGDALAVLQKAVDSTLATTLVAQPASLSLHEGTSGLLLVGNAGNGTMELVVTAPTGTSLQLLGGLPGQTAAYEVSVAMGAESGVLSVTAAGAEGIEVPLTVVPDDSGGNTPPTVVVTAPGDGSTVTDSATPLFTATATDAQDGDLGDSLTWSSNLDGPLGEGAAVLANLSQGVHTITATAGDSEGLQGSASITITVTDDGPALGGAFEHQVVASSLAQPVALEFLPDGRLIVLQKQGRIIIGDPATLPMAHSTFMHVSDIDHGGERGVIDLALDPDYETNKYFYLYYSPASTGHFRISRFTDTGSDITRGGTEVVLWEDTTGSYDSCCHYGAGLSVGPDGKLWLTTGDQFYGLQASGENPATDLTRFQGKVIRINTDGTIPDGTDGWPANPYLDDPNALDAIWAYGLRNPFRASWDLESERFFIAEVGGDQNTISWEDLHVAKAEPEYAGLNYGWPDCEGLPPYRDYPTCPFAGDDLGIPIFAYEHSGGGASITGGFVYRNGAFPAGYDGVYFYGDYVRETIRYLTFDDDGPVTGDFPFASNVGYVVDLAQGTDGALYYADVTGSVKRYVFDEGNQAPSVVSATAAPTVGAAPLTVAFDAEVADVDGDALTYEWDFGDGTSATGSLAAPGALPAVDHEYASAGSYTAQLHVSDALHTTSSSPITIQVGEPPVAEITSPSDGDLFRAGEIVGFSAPPPGPGETYEWTVVFVHNEHTHPVLDGVEAESGSIEIPTAGHSYESDTGYRFTLLVTDDLGLTDTASVTVYPDKVNLVVDTVPTGLTSVTVDTLARATPLTLSSLIDFQHTVSVPETVCSGGTSYAFVDWSDGGAREHVITIPETSSTLTATYAAAGSCP